MTAHEGAHAVLILLYIYLGFLITVCVGAIAIFIFQSRERSRQFWFRPEKLKRIAAATIELIQEKMGGGSLTGSDSKMREYQEREGKPPFEPR